MMKQIALAFVVRERCGALEFRTQFHDGVECIKV
jgi:hypothetical protein